MNGSEGTSSNVAPEFPIANESRLRPIADLREWYPHLGFAGRNELCVVDEGVFVTDPIYLADIYNPNEDPNATYLRWKAVVVSDFGGNTAVPVWWKEPFLVLPTSQHDQSPRPEGAKEITREVGCDSASFVFIALGEEVPPQLRGKIDELERRKNGAQLKAPRGSVPFLSRAVHGAREAQAVAALVSEHRCPVESW
jgi:hypothetical protein